MARPRQPRPRRARAQEDAAVPPDRPPAAAAAVTGAHYFLWIPAIGAAEAHPFTLLAADPPEFVVAPCGRFTRRLHAYALAHPGDTLRAAVDGPYGVVLDAAAFDTVVLIAGGSGASFALAVALVLLPRLPAAAADDDDRRLVFAWAVRHSSYLDCFGDQLDALRLPACRISLHLFVTRQPASPPPMLPTSETGESSPDVEKGLLARVRSQPSSPDLLPRPPRLPDESRPDRIHDIAISYRRPDLPALVRAALAATPQAKRALVLCCGPVRMMNEVRDATARSISGPMVLPSSCTASTLHADRTQHACASFP